MLRPLARSHAFSFLGQSLLKPTRLARSIIKPACSPKTWKGPSSGRLDAEYPRDSTRVFIGGANKLVLSDVYRQVRAVFRSRASEPSHAEDEPERNRVLTKQLVAG
jgi:hypothetical protein